MLASRQVWSRLALADVVLFLIAAAMNDQSSTSVDGIIWWVAIALFGVLIVVACVVLVGLIRSRARRPRRPRTR
jgi:intracellular septation protein A